MSTALELDGVTLIKNSDYAICYIEDFSELLKDLIREKLSSICYGYSKGLSNKESYTYGKTLKEFLKRYSEKSDEIKKGMIGELLAHIIFLFYFKEFDVISPYFNLEERSIKKGFDLILFSSIDKALWITEIKSGELHQNKTANETNSDLLHTAKRDLKRRLNNNETTLWENAINGAMIALDKKKDTKDAVLELLDNINDNVSEEELTSADINVVLSSSLFCSLTDGITEDKIESIYNNIKNENLFKQTFLLSIQKETYSKIADFLIQESSR